jgi:hypothetical protein
MRHRFNSALSLAKSFDIRGVSDSMPRRCGRQTTRVNHPAETQKQYWRISLAVALATDIVNKTHSFIKIVSIEG